LISGDSGIVFKVYPTIANPSNPTVQIPYFIDPLSTVTLLIQLNANPEPAHETFPLTIADDGLSASYTTVGSEFPTGGLYKITMRIRLGNSRLTADPPTQMFIDADFTP
jgi:hypothetical protein